ncbi:hypothetical protein PIB30_003378 [Stylosanthes scabra]|uniref:Secreted protein n=1 Tax=Stylosanthes scabra TaxID=79078 RepID=A0ABU6T308_9FABA|nr:hypothetical protein [Stylosanthes scabra]
MKLKRVVVAVKTARREAPMWPAPATVGGAFCTRAFTKVAPMQSTPSPWKRLPCSRLHMDDAFSSSAS